MIFRFWRSSWRDRPAASCSVFWAAGLREMRALSMPNSAAFSARISPSGLPLDHGNFPRVNMSSGALPASASFMPAKNLSVAFLKS